MRNEPYRTTLTGWGRHPVVKGLELSSENLEQIAPAANLSRGLGRSYGDSSLPALDEDVVANTTFADRLISFDNETGMLRAEAGVALLQLNRVFLPRCWFVPVSPGTQFVTLGGMVASDVHGKNHHVDGCFGEHVQSLRLQVADGRIIDCSDHHEPDLFRATIGGMGLTGHIHEVEFRMRRVPTPWIWQESERIGNLDRMISELQKAAANWPMTVGWIDSMATGQRMGRGVLIRGRWAEPHESHSGLPREKLRWRIPFYAPNWVMNLWSMKVLNDIYFWKHARLAKRCIVHPETFFYPLDTISDWNLIYGRRGFTQYQCVLPHAEDNGPVKKFLERFASSQHGAIVCVIKDCGAEGKGMMSFPRSGISIAVDFPIHPHRTPRLVNDLNELVLSEGGRIYLSKDTFTQPEHFHAMEPRLKAWNQVRERWDPRGELRSRQSMRLLGNAE